MTNFKTLRLRAAKAAAALAAAGFLLGNAPAPGTYVAFISCPLLRDTKELPCWMAKDKDTLYYVIGQVGREYKSDAYTPQHKHKVLVEGTVAGGAPVCGGVALKDVRTSVLPEISPECTTMLPANGAVSPPGRPIGPDPALELSQPQGGQTALLYTPEEIAARAPKQFVVNYDFESDFLKFPREQNRINQIQAYAKAIKAKSIRMVVRRGANLLSNGQVVVEDPVVPATRRDNLMAVLVAYDIPPEMISAEVRTAAEPARGENDYRNRQVDIFVSP